jgi:hypothetical protein
VALVPSDCPFSFVWDGNKDFIIIIIIIIKKATNVACLQ